jgi:hypothetical protein
MRNFRLPHLPAARTSVRRAAVAGAVALGVTVSGATGVAAAATDLPSSSANNETVQSAVDSLQNWYDNTDVVGSLASIVGSVATGGSSVGSWMYLLPSTGQ